MKRFGFFKGQPYGNCEEDFEDFRRYKNSIPKEKVIEHVKSDDVESWATSVATYDMFTGELLDSGFYEDGDFRFPYDFLHYYKNYDIGIPYDYEEYLKRILGL